jgi:deoxycytidylate deaminase
MGKSASTGGLMTIKFTDSFEELQSRLSTLGGEWSEESQNKKVLRIEGGVLNWFTSTGTIQFQGKSPGLEKLQNSVLHLLYPDEYSEPANTEDLIPKGAVAALFQDSSVTSTIESSYLLNKFSDTELIIGIVNPVGTESNRVLEPLRDRLRIFGYQCEDIRVSELLPTPSSQENWYIRTTEYMRAGDQIRRETGNNAILAAGVADQIKSRRQRDCTKVAYIVNSLKHPAEVEYLRRIYGNGFYLIGIHADVVRRHDFLVSDKGVSQAHAEDLIRIDEDEKTDYGQKTRDTYHLSDFFISLGNNNDFIKNTLQRFLELLFSNPFRGPTFDEFAMFMAFSSSIRSSDLSRQVGAVIASNCQIIATGANDVPRPGGGQYWTEINPESGEAYDVPGGKDYKKGSDSNKLAQSEIISEITNQLMKSLDTDELKRKAIEDIVKSSGISDLTEYGRVVHAEMNALLSCARIGTSTDRATLYCTTFPCHNCAKHIIDAGIKRVVYVEPYPKSRAFELHSDAITPKTESVDASNTTNILFEPFTGVGARRFLDLFSISLGAGSKIKRKDKNGYILEWDKNNAPARTPLLPRSYLDVEGAASEIWKSK